MQYMRTHVYTQGGKPILASFGHYAQVGFAVCAAVWAVLFFALRPLFRKLSAKAKARREEKKNTAANKNKAE